MNARPDDVGSGVLRLGDFRITAAIEVLLAARVCAVHFPDMPSASGYSGTPLAKKLGIVSGTVVLTKHAPDDYGEWLAPLPPDVTFVARMSARVDVVHLFATERAALAAALTSYRTSLRDNAAVWVSWPKRMSKVPTDITEDVIRAVALPMGFVDIKVCAVSDVWSGLKLVIRKTERGARAGT